uniref:RecBCD enzyme subunit RecC n=1 Tax=uncultured Nocardioidaceae bacterium TaxID=253824 RepID=A0A6J4MPM5_9ACTN|nr:MAG: Exodeoxyribonuclease V gamma chain [uncultured Nocardioidaceae bacterium]
MSLHLHRSERADVLVEALAEVLDADVADPFALDVVAVPAKGVERWLSQRLAHTLGAVEDGAGVCANVRFPSPTALIADAVHAVAGEPDDADPWAPERMVWRLLEVIDACSGEDWCTALGRHLGNGPGRRFSSAQHVGRLFASYGEQRPELVREWHAGRDTDGAGSDLPEDLRWQAELWRRLRASIGSPSPAERLEEVCARITAEPGAVELPHRLSLFGPTRLTVDQVAVLGALAAHRDVHLWLPHPSPALWDRVPAVSLRPRRREDPSAQAPRHPLIASLGRDAREMQLLLPSDTDTHHRLVDVPTTLLGHVQADLRADTPPTQQVMLQRGDRSLQVHACHGRARQVEVLREVLLGLLAADPTLEPRDMLVMCPDVETYAPLISATFGLGDVDGTTVHPGHRLRVRLADRSLRQTNPLLATIARLLELADARVTASQLLDLAAFPPVRRRFRFDDDELERVRDWVTSAGVRWGLDAQHRAPFKMERVAQNTWEAGLDRVLTGVTMSEDQLRWLGLALPLDDVDSNDIDLAGRVAELVDRLEVALDRMRKEQSLIEWVDALDSGLAALTSVSDADAWQLNQARRELASVTAAAGDHAASARLGLGDVRSVLADRLRGRPTRAGFRTGNLTVCSMVPMRSVPHRVVCLLGLDDGVFPRTAGVDGDDVLGRDPLVGERDRRSEDRQLLLDAMLAAREHLVILHTGADERTNTLRPPAVPVGEILDVVDATARTVDGRPAREQVVVRHPLQPFDARNFVHGALVDGGPFSFDDAGLDGARAAALTRRPAEPFLSAPLPEPEPDALELEPLIRFLEHPVRGFCRQRLGVSAPEQGEELADSLTTGLAPLDKWAVGDRWLRWRLTGADVEACRQAEWRRGALPPGALGKAALDEIVAEAEPLLAAGADYRAGPARVIDVEVAIASDRLLTGTVGGVHDHTIARTVWSKLAAKHRLRGWVQLLALAAGPSGDWRAVSIGKGVKGPMRSVLLPDDDPIGVLRTLVDLHARGLREPLPLPLGASLAYAEMRFMGDDEEHALEKAAKAFVPFEAEDRDHRTVWGLHPRFDDVLEQDPSDEDQPVGVVEAESTRFGALACRLWLPLLAAETLERP